ncbi:hypothetical protein [Micavibrio aeruginosavorus]|uniref:hypothetical protein n=1 Tax=Micavibrio aeruginosavorus TaxID=349221 RepID=UPI003F4AEBB3
MTDLVPQNGQNPDDNNGEEKDTTAVGFVRRRPEEEETEEERADRRLREDATANALIRLNQVHQEEGTETFGSARRDEADDFIEAEFGPAEKNNGEAAVDAESLRPDPERESLHQTFNRIAQLQSALCKVFELETVNTHMVEELAKTVTVTVELEQSFEAKGTDDAISVSRDHIFAQKNDVSFATAYEMTLIAMVDPSLCEDGVDVRGNTHDRLILSIVAQECGLKVNNAPDADPATVATLTSEIQTWLAQKNGVGPIHATRDEEEPEQKPAYQRTFAPA